MVKCRHFWAPAKVKTYARGIMKFEETWQQVAKNWDAGKTVWSAELGGIGPGYEQAIQELVFGILSKWPKDKILSATASGESYPKEYDTFVDKVAHDLDKKVGGFSGAQVGTAKATAFQFIAFGYAFMMNKCEKGRLIQVSKLPGNLRFNEGNA